MRNRDIYYLQAELFYIDSIVESCPLCELFKTTPVFEQLPYIGSLVSKRLNRSINYLFYPRPCEWESHNCERYPDNIVSEAAKEGKKLKTFNPSKEDLNYSIAYRYEYPFPSLVLYACYSETDIEKKVISGIDPRQENKATTSKLIEVVVDYLAGDIPEYTFNQIKKSFESEIARQRKDAISRRESKKEDRRKGLNISFTDKYEEFSEDDLLKLLKIAEESNNAKDAIRITNTLHRKGYV